MAILYSIAKDASHPVLLRADPSNAVALNSDPAFMLVIPIFDSDGSRGVTETTRPCRDPLRSPGDEGLAELGRSKYCPLRYSPGIQSSPLSFCKRRIRDYQSFCSWSFSGSSLLFNTFAIPGMEEKISNTFYLNGSNVGDREINAVRSTVRNWTDCRFLCSHDFGSFRVRSWLPDLSCLTSSCQAVPCQGFRAGLAIPELFVCNIKSAVGYRSTRLEVLPLSIPTGAQV